MKNLKLAVRKLFRKGEHSVTRVISLAAGLAFGLILLSEVFYYYSFDNFYPDANRVYVVNTVAKLDKSSDKLSTFPQVSGAIGPGLKAEVPGIEAATRINSLGKNTFYSEDNNSYKAKVALADEHWSDVLPRPMLAGVAKEVLSSPMTCMVSSKIAQNMGGSVVGQTIELKDYPGKKITIAGIFEEIPENSNYKFDIAISMVSTGNFIWDGTQNWLGNDRYFTAVKLEKGISPKSLAPAVRKMQEKHQNIEELERKHNLVLKYDFEALQDFFPNKVKNMIFILSAIAFIVLFVSIMNYMLLTISTLVNRTKTSAILKCYGAEKKNLLGMIFTESLLIFLISLAVAFVLILIIKPFVESQVAHSLSAILNPYVVVRILVILSIIILSIGYFPGRVFAQTPVAAAFRTYRKKGTQWKKGLLAVQFASAGLILTMLFVVSLQYEKIKNHDHGYATEDVYYGSVSGMNPHKVLTVVNELKALPEVKNVGFGKGIPFFGASGNNVLSPERDKELFNVADFYYVDDAYFSILEIPIASGTAFTEGISSPNDVLISQKGADLLVMNNQWTDGVVGKDIEITEHNAYGSSRISGVFNDVIVGNISDTDHRPSVFFYAPKEEFIKKFEKYPNYNFMILIKTFPGKNINVIQQFTDIFNSAMTRPEAQIYSLDAELLGANFFALVDLYPFRIVYPYIDRHGCCFKQFECGSSKSGGLVAV